MLVVEICAGSARLTKTCRRLSLRGLAIDRSKERSCGTDILVLDLTIQSQLQLLLDILKAERDKLLLVFIAPPCGTASRARGRPIKTSLLRGRKAPRPLRTDAQPDGIDGLQRTDKLKTELANQLYEAISTIVLFTHGLDVCVVVEIRRTACIGPPPSPKSILTRSKVFGQISTIVATVEHVTNLHASGAIWRGWALSKFFVTKITRMNRGDPEFKMANWSFRPPKKRLTPGFCAPGLQTSPSPRPSFWELLNAKILHNKWSKTILQR